VERGRHEQRRKGGREEGKAISDEKQTQRGDGSLWRVYLDL